MKVSDFKVFKNDKWWKGHAQEILKGNTDMYLHAKKYIKKFDTAIDGGVHYGYWSMILAQDFKKVFCFEGDVKLFEIAKENLSKLNNVILENKAIGNKIDSVEVSNRFRRCLNSSMSRVLGPGKTPMITIDSLNLSDLDFMKLDIEGYELFALKGSEETLKKYKPVVLFEEIENHCNFHGVNLGECDDFLTSIGATHLESWDSKNHIWGWRE